MRAQTINESPLHWPEESNCVHQFKQFSDTLLFMAIRFGYGASAEHIFNSGIGSSTTALKYSCFMMDIVSASQYPPTGCRAADIFCALFWPQPSESLQCDFLSILLYLQTSVHFLAGRSLYTMSYLGALYFIITGVKKVDS